MSILYLCRHAIAEDAKPGQSDADRALTPEGIKKFRRAAEGILKVVGDNPPRLILTSPLMRSRQTAEILAETFDRAKLKADLRIATDLGSDGKLSGILKATAGQTCLVVGHEPSLSDWIAQLCFHGAGGLGVEMKKGALAALDVRSLKVRKTPLSAPARRPPRHVKSPPVPADPR